MRLPSQVLAVRGTYFHFSCFEFGHCIDSNCSGKNLSSRHLPRRSDSALTWPVLLIGVAVAL